MKWIEELRSEGHPRAVLDELLAPLVAAGLKTWADCEPIGPARQVCLDLGADTVPVLEAVREVVLSEFKHRMPPVAKLREIAATARQADTRRLREFSRQRGLAAVPVRHDVSERFLAALDRVAKPEVVAAWFAPAGVVSVDGTTVTVVTTHKPVHVEQFCQSLANAAARSIWGAGAEVRFVQGRPEETTR